MEKPKIALTENMRFQGMQYGEVLGIKWIDCKNQKKISQSGYPSINILRYRVILFDGIKKLINTCCTIGN